MKQVTKSTLVKIVRTNLDELGVNDSMMLGGSDDAMLDDIIWNVAGECADEIHSAAPVQLLDGESPLAKDSDYDSSKITVGESNAKVLLVPIANVIRLVAFKAKDSDYVVTDTIPEASPEGRMQLDPNLSGTFDDPKVVMQQGSSDSDATMKYYSLKDELGENASAASKVEKLSVIFRQFGKTDLVKVADNVASNFYDLVTAKVLTIMGDQRAQEYYNKAKFV